MVQKNLNKYRLYCTTEKSFQTVWQNTVPKSCPNDHKHIIDENSITILDVVSTNLVTIENNFMSTGGNYRIEGFKFDIPATSNVYLYKTSKPIDVMCYNMYLNPTASNLNDTVSVFSQFVIPLESTIHSGSSNIIISPTILNNLQCGYEITLSNATASSYLGIITSVNSNSFDTEYCTSNLFHSNDYVYIRKYFGKNVFFPIVPQSYCIGQGTLNGTFVPKGTFMHVEYINNNIQNKQFAFSVEYMY